MPTKQFKWEVCGDPVLSKMANAAAEYVAGVRAGGGGWLSFVGPSGTGKTYIGTEIVARLNGDTKHWPRFMAKMRSKQYNIFESVQDLATNPRSLLLDEIGMGIDARDFGTDLLLQVFEMRRSRPTVLTSNLTLKQLGQIDGRLASRLLRYGQVIECNTVDFAVRKPNARHQPRETARE